MINPKQKERILALYQKDRYGYKKLAQALGLTRDQVRSVIKTAIQQGIKLHMAKFILNTTRNGIQQNITLRRKKQRRVRRE